MVRRVRRDLHARAVPRDDHGRGAAARGRRRRAAPMKVPPFAMPLEEIRGSLAGLRRPLSVAILRARNPFNVGAIIRVAHSFLAREIILVGHRAVLRARVDGHGALRDDRARCPTRRRSSRTCARSGRKLVVFEKEAARVDLWHADLPEDCVMLFGSETTGVPDGARRGGGPGRRDPHVRHQPLVPRDGRRRHRHGRVDPAPLRLRPAPDARVCVVAAARPSGQNDDQIAGVTRHSRLGLFREARPAAANCRTPTGGASNRRGIDRRLPVKLDCPTPAQVGNMRSHRIVKLGSLHRAPDCRPGRRARGVPARPRTETDCRRERPGPRGR